MIILEHKMNNKPCQNWRYYALKRTTALFLYLSTLSRCLIINIFHKKEIRRTITFNPFLLIFFFAILSYLFISLINNDIVLFWSVSHSCTELKFNFYVNGGLFNGSFFFWTQFNNSRCGNSQLWFRYLLIDLTSYRLADWNL